MVSVRTVATELAALGTAALSLPLSLLLRHDRHDARTARPPVLLVHGFLGDPTNFLVLRTFLTTRGVGTFASFAYGWRLDYQRLATRLGEAVDTLCSATGAPEVDVVGHSLGGLVARYLVELAPRTPVRSLVTLGAPYFASPLPLRETSIFGAGDPFIAPPHPLHGPHAAHAARGGRVLLVPHCGHWGLLYHPAVLHEIDDVLLRADGAAPMLSAAS
jgi:pimeloyl-ACP methyl ester carboxylesterase